MREKGFTLAEIVIGVAIFVLVAVGAYQGFRSLYLTLEDSRQKMLAADLINEKFEIIRNLPYASVVSGSENVSRGNTAFGVVTTVRNIDDPFDGVAPGDTKPADYKLVEIAVSCQNCRNFATVSVTGRIAPQGLEP